MTADVTTAEVWVDGDDLRCDWGKIDTPHTLWHDTYTRPCVHAYEPLPRALLFHKEHILRVGFQPVVYTGPNWPAIVRRNGDIVTMAFDRMGDIRNCHNRPSVPFAPKTSWRYQLLPMRWWDGPADNVLLGVWPD